MDYRPNSWPERTGPFMTYTNTLSRDIGPDEDRGHSPIRSLNEHFVMKRAIKQWTSPKHPNFNLIDARLDSFQNWPRGSPSPEHLAKLVSFSLVCTKQFLVYFKFSIFFTYTKIFYIFSKRGWDNLLLLWGWYSRMATFRQCVARTRTLVTLLCFCQIHQRPCFCSWE